MEAQAILTNKRVCPDLPEGSWFKYIVDVRCSNCSLQTIMAFSGWTAVICTGCRQPMQRTPYRASTKATI